MKMQMNMNDRAKEIKDFHCNTVNTLKEFKDECDKVIRLGERGDNTDKMNKLRERFLKWCEEYCDKYDEIMGTDTDGGND